jgi:hypothetical protein
VLGDVTTRPLDDCRARNAERPARARVPDVGIFATINRFEPPTAEEGFDELWTVNTLPDFRFEVLP